MNPIPQEMKIGKYVVKVAFELDWVLVQEPGQIFANVFETHKTFEISKHGLKDAHELACAWARNNK